MERPVLPLMSEEEWGLLSLMTLDFYTTVEEASTLEWVDKKDKKIHLHKFWVTCNDFSMVIVHMNFAFCSGLALANSQTLTQMLAHYHSAVVQGETMGWKSSQVEIKTERSITNCYHRQKRLNLRKINFLYCKLK